MAQPPEPETIQQVKSAFEPYIKPREQVAYIRRVLALHLQRQRQTDNLQRPLSLLHTTDQVQHHRDTHGTQRDYLRAVRNNLKARQEYAQLRETTPNTATNGAQHGPADHIQEHLALIKLQQKHDKLATIQKYLDLLVQQPAASPDFLDLEDLIRDSPELPAVPREVVNSFSTDVGSAKEDLTDVVDEMEKVVLRTKLLLRQEEKLLNEARSRTEPLTHNISDATRQNALNITRNELINWIETELGKASGDGTDDGNQDESAQAGVKAVTADTDISEQLAQVKAKYANYTATRKSLLTIVSQQPRPTLKPDLSPETPRAEESDESPGVTGHLILPYLEKLLDLSRQQKSMIQHKSHINTVLAQQVKDTRQMLNHLAEESQLLPSHPMPGVARGKSGFDEHVSAATSDKPDTISQLRPWVYAADSAKIATMEAVAEKVEEGHLALEGSMKALYDVDQLLGRHGDRIQSVAVGDTTEDDIWLAEESAPKAAGRRHADRPQGKQTESNDPWSVLDGKLGLMG